MSEDEEPEIIEMKPILLPAAPGKCPECATEHEPELPHNQQSLYYQTRFHLEHGRSPTWTDAMEHCTDEMKEFWTRHLTAHVLMDKKS